jgi:predicted RNase H-like HicB family nuclease
MTGSEFIHRAQRYAKVHGSACRMDRKRGNAAMSPFTLVPP